MTMWVLAVILFTSPKQSTSPCTAKSSSVDSRGKVTTECWKLIDGKLYNLVCPKGTGCRYDELRLRPVPQLPPTNPKKK